MSNYKINNQYLVFAIILIPLIFYALPEVINKIPNYNIYIQFYYFLSVIFILFYFKDNWFKISLIIFIFYNLCIFLISTFRAYFINNGIDLYENSPYFWIFIFFILIPNIIIYLFSIVLFLIIKKFQN